MNNPDIVHVGDRLTMDDIEKRYKGGLVDYGLSTKKLQELIKTAVLRINPKDMGRDKDIGWSGYIIAPDGNLFLKVDDKLHGDYICVENNVKPVKLLPDWLTEFAINDPSHREYDRPSSLYGTPDEAMEAFARLFEENKHFLRRDKK